MYFSANAQNDRAKSAHGKNLTNFCFEIIERHVYEFSKVKGFVSLIKVPMK